MNNIAVILASGQGSRYGSSVPKQFCKLNGKPVILYSIDEFIKSNLFDRIIVVVSDLRYSYIFKSYKVKIIKGGATRTFSVANALAYAKKLKPKNIVFHDAVRPLIKAEDLKQYIDYLTKYDAVVTAEVITDSLYPSVHREDYKLTQTPEAFNFKVIEECFKMENAHYTAIYQHLKPIYTTKRIFLNHSNIKITYPYDLFTLEHLIKYNRYEKGVPDLTNKTILILGASGGIGQAIVKELKRYKCKILTPTSKELDLRIDFSAKLPKADVIINVSGIAYKDEEGILKHYDDIMNINFKANVILLNEVIKWKHDSPINIVLISSSSATKGREGFTIYSASKKSVHSLVESQAEILAKHNIFLNCICPEKVKTPLLKKLQHRRVNVLEILEPSKVAEAILSYCDTKKRGQIIHLRKGF